jgi:alkylation response protein AidB-like acyl-CoA dehydrogenase
VTARGAACNRFDRYILRVPDRLTAIERMARDARFHSIGGGATEVMLEEVAKRL